MSKSQKSLAQRIVAHNVRVERARLNITQEGLAEAAGVHRTMIGFIERGERKLSIDVLFKIASGLDVDPRALLKPLEEE